MHQRSPERPLTLHAGRTGGVTGLAAALLGMIAVSGAACGDKDDTQLMPPGGGGSAGSAGTGGSAGTAGTAGTAGSGGTGGLSDAGPDAAVDPSAADQTLAVSYCARLEAISSGGADADAGASDAGDAGAPACSPPPDCVDALVGAFAFFRSYVDVDCQEAAIGYYRCVVAADDPSNFACFDGVLDINYGGTTCPDEEAAFLSVDDGSSCPPS